MSTEFGFLYALTNAAMPGHIKIGMTRRRPEERMAELSSATGVPVEFRLAYSRAFENARLAEALVHQQLEAQGLRVSQSREFFQITVRQATAAIDDVAAQMDSAGAREPTQARFGHLADELLAQERPSPAQLERALSYLEYAGELGSPEHRYRAAALAQELAGRRAADSARGQAYRERAHRLFAQAGEEGVARAHAQRAVLYLETDEPFRAQAALGRYLAALPAGRMPPAELDYLLGTLQQCWMPHRGTPSLVRLLHPWRTQLAQGARRRVATGDPFLSWLQRHSHTKGERRLERAKLPALAAGALAVMYLANPAAFYVALAAAAALGLRAWRWRRRRAGARSVRRYRKK
jgi:hypothetical protein